MYNVISLGVGRQSEYIRTGFVNREGYNNYLNYEGPIGIDDRVICGGDNDGTLVTNGKDGTLTIKLLTWGTEVKYDLIFKARMRHREPSLND